MEIQQMLQSDRLDSGEYEVLLNAVDKCRGVPGASFEIGMRRGGSSLLIMQQFLKNNDKRPHVATDPYGNIEYTHFETQVIQDSGYSRAMKHNAVKFVHDWCEQHDYEFIFFPLEDTEYFKRFSDGFPIYDSSKRIETQYSLVFFDGPHSTEILKQEIDFLGFPKIK